MSLLEFDGQKLVQTGAIASYLACKAWILAGKEDFEAAKIDDIVDGGVLHV